MSAAVTLTPDALVSGLATLDPGALTVLHACAVLAEQPITEVGLRAALGIHEKTPAKLEGIEGHLAGPATGTPEVDAEARQTLLLHRSHLLELGWLEAQGNGHRIPPTLLPLLPPPAPELRTQLELTFVVGMLEWVGRNAHQLTLLLEETSSWNLALKLAKSGGQGEEYGLLIGHLARPGGFFHRRRDMASRARLLADAVTTLAGRGDGLEAWILYLHAGLLRELGQLDQACSALERSEALSRAQKDTRAQGMALGELAAIRMLQTRFPEAIELFHGKLDAMQKVSDPREFQVTLGELTEALTVAGKLEEALTLAEQRVGLLQTMQDERTAALAGLGMGDILAEMNRFDDAILVYREAISALEGVDPRNRAVALGNLAIFQAKRNLLPDARATLKEAVEQFTQLGLKQQAAQAQAFLEELGG